MFQANQYLRDFWGKGGQRQNIRIFQGYKTRKTVKYNYFKICHFAILLLLIRNFVKRDVMQNFWRDRIWLAQAVRQNSSHNFVWLLGPIRGLVYIFCPSRNLAWHLSLVKIGWVTAEILPIMSSWWWWWWCKVIFVSNPTYIRLSCGWVGVLTKKYLIIGWTLGPPSDPSPA